MSRHRGAGLQALIPVAVTAVALSTSIACPAASAATDPQQGPATAPQDVVVEAEKLAVETLIDRKVYSVAPDAQSTFGSLSDVLSVIPSVDVDPDGIVSLRGDTHVLILIDGKPATQLSGSAAGDSLQSIPAKDIERIEVLTNPPPEFKAEGSAGVINIITRNNSRKGMSGSVSGSLGSGGRSVAGMDGSYGSGPLALSGTAGYRQDYRHRLTRSEISSADSPTAQLMDSSSSIDERIRREIPTLGASAEYAWDERRSISASLKWDDRGGLRTYTELNDISNPFGVVTGSSRRLSSGHDPQIDLDQKLSFSQKLGRAGESLAFSLHRSTSQQHEHYDYVNDSFVPPTATFLNNLSFQENRGATDFSADYSLPLSKLGALKLGIAFEQDDYAFGNVGANVDPMTAAQTVDPALTDDFRFRQRIEAAYASYRATAGAWSWLGGMRAEWTHTDAQQLTEAISRAGSYFALYPNLHLERSLWDRSTLSFGVSRRVTRPDPQNLNPFVDREYTPNLRAGNPGLRPQYTRSYEVGYGFTGAHLSCDLTGYYQLNRDTVTDLTENLGNGLTLTTRTNLPRNDSAGVEFTADGPIVPKLTYVISGNLFYSQIDATALGISGLQSTTGLNAKVKLDYRPTARSSAQLTVTRTDKRLTPQGYVSAIDIVNLGYKRTLRTMLTGVMTVSDLFDGQRFRRFTTAPTFTQDYRRTVLGRVFYVGLVYSFGSTSSDKQPELEYDPSGG